MIEKHIKPRSYLIIKKEYSLVGMTEKDKQEITVLVKKVRKREV